MAFVATVFVGGPAGTCVFAMLIFWHAIHKPPAGGKERILLTFGERAGDVRVGMCFGIVISTGGCLSSVLLCTAASLRAATAYLKS